MSYPTRPELPDTPPPGTRCSVCGEDIVPAEARSVELQDYMLYFCGLDCFQKWRDEQQRGESEDS